MDVTGSLVAVVSASGLGIEVARVLLPLSAIGAVLMVASRRFSRRFAPVVVAVAGAGGVAALVGGVTWMVLGYLGGLTAFWLVDRGIPGNRPRSPLALVLATLVSIAALGVVLRVVQSVPA